MRTADAHASPTPPRASTMVAEKRAVMLLVEITAPLGVSVTLDKFD